MNDVIEKLVNAWWESITEAWEDSRYSPQGPTEEFESLLTKTLPKYTFIYNGTEWKILRSPIPPTH